MLDPIRVKARVIALTSGAFLGGVILASGLEWTTGIQAATLLQTAPSSSEVRPIAELSEAFISISESVTPAVVSISTERLPSGPSSHPEVPEEFRRFFRIPPRGDGPPMPQEGGGTGFVISDDGYILTNNHVVEGATRIRVRLEDRREFDAVVVGNDPDTDVAVIRIDAANLPVVRFGRPDQTRVGEWVLAIGNPLGLDFTVTAGIVSAKGRPLNIIQSTTGSAYAIESFIQTDAAINPGNSGGPLVNIRGEVIGINSAIASQTGYYAGYGFAVPIDLARRVADDLIRYGRTRRAILGVAIEEVTPEDAEAFRLPSVAGVVVQSFSQPGQSPAERAGLRAGDVIVGVDDRPVGRLNELQTSIAGHRPGETVKLHVIRYGERLEFDVQLGEAPTPEREARADAAPPAVRPIEGTLGLSVAPLTAALAGQYRFQEPGGVVITEVQPFGPAGRKSVRDGWKVVRVDRQEIREVEEFERVLAAKRPGDIVTLTLRHPTGTQRIYNIRVPG